MCVHPVDGKHWVGVWIRDKRLWFAVYIPANADSACGIWTGMERGDGEGTAVDAQVRAWGWVCVDGVARFRRQRWNEAQVGDDFVQKRDGVVTARLP